MNLPAANPLTQTPPANRQVYVRYEYDNDGKQTRLSVDGASYDYTFAYDAMGRFEKIKNTSNSAEWFRYVYDLASNETERWNVITGVKQIYTRDWLNRVAQRDVKKGANTISSEIYEFDDMSRLTSVTREDNKRDAFTYDYSGQMTSAQYGLQKVNNVWVNPARPVSYTWDKAGNRICCTDNGAACDYLTNGLNQYTAAGADAVYNGSEHEISNYQGKTYGYVNDERLASISQPNGASTDNYQLAYDALGRCVKRTMNGIITYYVYDGEKPILEYNNVYQRVGWNLYGKGIDEILMRTDYVILPSGQGYFYQQDHEGSVTHLTGWIGEVIESYRYDAFGAITTTSTTGVFNSRFKFTGREYIPTFGVYEYRNRAYHPGLGRFTSEDPMGFAAGDSNLFRYCGNDPIDRVDPMGLLSGYRAYELVRTNLYDDTHDGYEIKGIKGTENQPGDPVHLEADRSVTTVGRIGGDKGGDTRVTTDVSNKGGVPTLHRQIDVRYAGAAGPKTKEFTKNNEWTHSRDAINSANALRSELAGFVTIFRMSSDRAMNFIRNGEQFGRVRTPSLQGRNQQFLNEQKQKWDNPLSENGWRAPNGMRVAPHNPIDPETGNPLRWNE